MKLPTTGNGTDLVYNGVTMVNVTTRDFLEEAKYDSSRTDLIGTRYYLLVTGYVLLDNYTSPAFIGTSGYGASGGFPNTVAAEAGLAALLLTPRKLLQYSIGGIRRLSVNSPAEGAQPPFSAIQGGTDIDNGPKPLDVRVSQIAGKGFFRIDYEIECTTDICGSSALGVLSNRWSLRETADASQYLIRVINGRLRVAANSTNPDTFRDLCFPSLAAGFRRAQISTERSMDGLELAYSVLDIAVDTAAPPPATEWTGIHTESNPGGEVCFGNVTIRMKGPPLVYKPAMIAQAFAIIENRLVLTTTNEQGEPIPTGGVNDASRGWQLVNIELQDYLDTSEIQISVTVQHSKGFLAQYADDNNPDILEKVFGSRLDALFDTQTSVPVPNYPAGSAAHGFVSFLQSPCGGTHSINDATPYIPVNSNPYYGSGTPNPNNPNSGQGGSPTPNRSTVPPDTTAISNNQNSGPLRPPPQQSISSNPFASAAEQSGVYASYEIESRYVIDQTAVQLPIAAPSAGAKTPTSIVVNMGPPIAKRVVRMDGSRIGAPPLTPQFAAYEDVGGGHATPIGRVTINIPPPTPTSNGQFQFHLQAEFWWALDYPPPQNQMTGALLPWANFSLSDIPAAQTVPMGSSSSVSTIPSQGGALA